MKKVLKLSLHLSLLLSLSLVLACGSRVPKDVKTAKLSRSYFKKYGKKYPETMFHQNSVAAVDIQKTQELQKDVATSFVVLELAKGEKVPILLTMIRKFPLGWRITGWEILQQ